MTFSDIDEQKKAQEKLKELTLQAKASQEYAESIVNTIKEPLLILDQDLIVRSANTTFYELFTTSPENLRDQPLGEILDGMWNVPPMIDRLRELSSKEVELENLSTEIVVPRLGKRSVAITARKLLIPSGISTMMLLSLKMEE